MPLSNNFAARVPLVSGKINKTNSEEVPNCVGSFTIDFLKKYHCDSDYA
jgi:hypothetical protein